MNEKCQKHELLKIKLSIKNILTGSVFSQHNVNFTWNFKYIFLNIGSTKFMTVTKIADRFYFLTITNNWDFFCVTTIITIIVWNSFYDYVTHNSNWIAILLVVFYLITTLAPH